MLSENLESRDLAIDALNAISRLADRFRDISSKRKGTDTLELIRRRMVGLQNRLTNLLASNETTEPVKQRQLQAQLTQLDSTWKSLIANEFCCDDDRQGASLEQAKEFVSKEKALGRMQKRC
jgi:hypothetical protein